MLRRPAGGLPVDWGVDERFERRTYLRPLAGGALRTRHSAGARRRAAALQRFLDALQKAAAPRLEPTSAPELLVLDAADWRRLSSAPYGLPLARRAGAPRVLAPAEYPERLLRRFDPLLLAAGRTGLAAPGELREFLDLVTALEWARASLGPARLRSPLPWLDEVNAAALALAALEAAGFAGARARLLVWGRLLAAGSEAGAPPLSRYAYPRGRAPLAQALYFLGRGLELAETLAQAGGWAYLEAWRGLNAEAAPHDLIARLTALEPAITAWLATFPEDA